MLEVKDRAHFLRLGVCEETQCAAEGNLRAPVAKRPDGTIVYQLFCKVHACERNMCWNYFFDMVPEDIEAFHHQGYSWSHRPNASDATLRAAARIESLFDETALFVEGRTVSSVSMLRRLPSQVREALGILKLKVLPDERTLKRHFRALVKLHHPDLHRCCDKADRHGEQLKRITAAYAIIKKCRHRSESLESE